jgi:UPF0755 protein
MNKRKRRSVFLLLVITTLLIGCVGLGAGFLAISSDVEGQFGKPSPNLSLTQKIAYPLDLYLHKADMTSPADPGGVELTFTIDQGESVSMICIRLESAGLISDAELLRTYLVYSGLDRYLQAGVFTLSPQMSPLQIAADLLDATPEDATVSILAGWRIEEVAANVAGSGLAIDAASFVSLAYNPTPELFAGLPLESAPTLEGLLFPGTYTVPREADLNTLMQTILGAFAENVDAAMLDGFARQGLSVYQAVTLASIVEKEAVVDEEKPMIASVFYNRLADGMRLETDPTVQYALGYQDDLQTWWKVPLSGTDLGIDSPYNTYLYGGLPLTAIANPDLASLNAVAFPAETPYYYFRAACDGSGRHNFAITYEEHLNNACE